ncbi:MAG: winged helix-turn-helix transcriptional regulator [Nocardioidaceae bacterium]|nr:winged helix-turn-helix transcriptional regulator [Nocardioidaceae bacterium]NUS53095.1 winged helix-turn-helix transcriptional regulator [Nocardioidaceae bacterium]
MTTTTETIAAPVGTPDPATEELLGALTRLSRVLKSTRFRPAGEVSLNRAEIGVLRWLEKHGETRVGDLACAFGLSPSVISRQVGSLVERDLVGRRPDPADARAGLITLTDRGRTSLDEMTRQYVRRLGEVVGDWAPEDRRHAAVLLTRLADRLAESHD